MDPDACTVNREAPRDAFATINAARAANHVTGVNRAVLYVLAMHADGPTGRNARPSVATIAAESGWGVTAVKEALKALSAAGLIRHTGYWQSRRGGKPVKVWALDLAALSGETVPNGREATIPNGRQAAMTYPVETSPIVDVVAGPPLRGRPGEQTQKPRKRDQEKQRQIDTTVGAALISAVGLPDAREPDAVERVLEGIREVEGPRVRDAGAWFAATLETKRVEEGYDGYEKYARHAYLKYGLRYDRAQDRDLFASTVYECGDDPGEERLAERYDEALMAGVHNPGLYALGISDSGGPTGVVEWFWETDEGPEWAV